VAADFFEAVFGQASGQVHADLAGLGDALTAFLALQIGQANVKMIGDHFDDIGDARMSG
jgi:hypothetical protein